MIHISDKLKTQIKEANDILEVAGEYFTLTQTGAIFQTTCIHEGEKHSKSLTFFPETQSFYCFGCGAGSKQMSSGSDVISFVMWVENCSWQEAVFKLCNRKGIAIPNKDLTKEEKVRARLLDTALKMNRTYYNRLQEFPDVLAYLYSRGFDDSDILKWRLGYVPDGDVTKAARRLVFGVMNDWGQTVAFSFRNMEGILPNTKNPDVGPKYFNSPESPIFKKGSTLYGLNFLKKLIREKDYVIIAEGFGDTILGQKFGLPIVSIMGTSLTKDHIEILGKYTKNVIVWMDGDPGGLGAALRHLDPLRAEGFLVKVLMNPGKDPDDVILEYGKHIEEYIMDHARLAGDFELGIVMEKYRSQVSELKLKTIRELIPMLKRMDNHFEHRMYLGQVSQDLGIPPEVFKEHLEEEVVRNGDNIL